MNLVVARQVVAQPLPHHLEWTAQLGPEDWGDHMLEPLVLRTLVPDYRPNLLTELLQAIRANERQFSAVRLVW